MLPPVNCTRSTFWKYTLPSSSTQHPAKLSNTENTTPNPPPTCTGKPAGDSIPGGASTPLRNSEGPDWKIPTLLPFDVWNPVSVSRNVTYTISPGSPLNDENDPF